MACLDTTFLIDLARPDGERRLRAVSRLRELIARGESPATTRLNVAELFVGVFRSLDPSRERRAVEGVLAGLVILEFTGEAAIVFGRMTAHLQKLGRPAGDMDVLIAATAVASGHPLLLTRNPSHFESLPGLTVEAH
ncbi:MAG: PIN domain-containing protein [Candidatus Riflebacteria bacterium]|nr:PIN domain-containing protein [Candidatus Riflebacteria bacterium]